MSALSALSWQSLSAILAAGLSVYWLHGWAKTQGVLAQSVFFWLCIELAFNAWTQFRCVSVSNVAGIIPTPVWTDCTLHIASSETKGDFSNQEFWKSLSKDLNDLISNIKKALRRCTIEILDCSMKPDVHYCKCTHGVDWLPAFFNLLTAFVYLWCWLVYITWTFFPTTPPSCSEAPFRSPTIGPQPSVHDSQAAHRYYEVPTHSLLACRYHIINRRVENRYEAHRVAEVKRRFLQLNRCMCIEDFLRGWFHGAPYETIRRGNVEDFVAYGFYCRTMDTLPPRVHSHTPSTCTCDCHHVHVIQLNPAGPLSRMP